MKSIPEILPVVHLHPYDDTALTQVLNHANLIFDKHNLNGLFLISHHAKELDVINNAILLNDLYPDKRIGVNCLSMTPTSIVETFKYHNFTPDIWLDYAGVDSYGYTHGTSLLSNLMKRTNIRVFSSVAFKYQPHEENPQKAADNARKIGFIPTTSGNATGCPPTTQKIESMYNSSGSLAVASGMTPENVGLYKDHLSHILVSTGISKDEYTIDPDKLKQFIDAVNG